MLMTQGDVIAINPAEAVLPCRKAKRDTPDELWRCTRVAGVEPCAAYSGTQHRAHIGRLVHCEADSELLAFAGAHPENPRLDLPRGDPFARRQKSIHLIGSIGAGRDEIAALHRAFW